MPRVTKQEPDDFPIAQLSFDFYDFPMIMDFDQTLEDIQLDQNPNEKEISKLFDKFSKTNYNSFLEQLFEYAELMNLNDWGYYLLLKNTAATLSPNDENTQRLFTWFLLIRSGYKAKIAYYENEVFLLLPIINQVYSMNFFTLNGTKFYLMDGDKSDVFTYEKDFPEAQKSIDLNVYKAISLGDNMATRNLTFNYNDEKINIPIVYSKSTINYYNDFPQADLKVYFDAVVSTETKTALANAFIPLIGEMNEEEAVNFLLHFVQTAFEYQTDQDQFGYEKFFFAEESFYYPYCDCEDRSVLFAYLVQSLLRLDVIGLSYPGHVSTAVCFNTDVAGDHINFEGKKYVIADPTYINAPVGLSMPEYKNEQAEVMVLNTKYRDGHQRNFLWDDIIAGGGQRGDNGTDMLLNADGSGFLTGYFTNNFSFGNIELSGGEKPSMFAMMLDANKSPVWVSNSSGSGMAIASYVARDKNNYYIAGTFDGEMKIDDVQIKSESGNPDVFVAGFTAEGTLIWLQKANIDTANNTSKPGHNYLNFVSTFDADGTHLSNDLYFETGDFSNYGISVLPSGEIAVAGAFTKTTGMNIKEISFDSHDEYNTVEALKIENDRFISEKYEHTIAGLFAVVSLVQSSGVAIPGMAAREVLDKYNPNFKKEYPEIYSTIPKIQFIKNQDGIVSIKTNNGKNLSISMMRISNDARLKVSMLENGDARIDVLSGIRVGKAVWWYDLNYILLFKQNGDLLFDYDTDHAQSTQNLRIDILY
jgi:hypothetical protein